MATGRYHHYGVPTTARREGECYLAGAKVHVTDPEKHPYRVEYVRFDADSPLPAELKDRAHVAFVVPNLEAALVGQKVVVPPFDATDKLRAAFVMDGEALMELLEEK